MVTRGYSYKSVVGHRNINGYSCVNVDKDVCNLYLAFLKQQMIINLSKTVVKFKPNSLAFEFGNLTRINLRTY